MSVYSHHRPSLTGCGLKRGGWHRWFRGTVGRGAEHVYAAEVEARWERIDLLDRDCELGVGFRCGGRLLCFGRAGGEIRWETPVCLRTRGRRILTHAP